MKPISCGLPTMSTDINGEHVMDTKSVLPLTPEVDALPLWDTIPILSVVKIVEYFSYLDNLAGASLVNSS